jgi:hypothetical protein
MMLAFGLAIWWFTGPVIDLGPRPTPVEKTPEIETPPDNGPGESNKPDDKPIPATGGSSRGPGLPDCDGVARLEHIRNTPVYRMLDVRGRTIGYVSRDIKWRNNPRQDVNCDVFEIYDARGRPLMEADCNCNDTGRSVAKHKPLNL